MEGSTTVDDRCVIPTFAVRSGVDASASGTGGQVVVNDTFAQFPIQMVNSGL